MKTFSMKSLALTTGMLLTLSFAVSPASYSQEGDHGKHTGFETGKHLGHTKDIGQRKGHENEKNPWYAPAGVDFDLTVHNHGIMPVVSFTQTYNSALTVQELIMAIVGEAADGFVLQQCYEVFDLIKGRVSDCSGDETTAPLDAALTLEQAGLLADPEVHLVFVD